MNPTSPSTAWLRRAAAGVPALIVFLVAATLAVAWPAGAQPASAPKAAATAPLVLFPTPEAGFEALIATLRANDAKGLARLLGPGHERIIDSGDSADDREVWARFVAAYDTRHGVQKQGDAKAVLTTGDSDWPMPIPLVRHAGGWAFDADAGEEELIARRIGRNELDTIQTCLAFVDMQREYAEVDRNGDGVLEYAGRFVSSDGKRDGLYWPTQSGEAPSPAGPRLADADPMRLKAARREPQPYHGYYYRILTAQGKHAPGGARSYLAGGRLIGGVALLAYPASYLNSGVKTFQCSLDGVVYEKDLGVGTKAAAARIVSFDPAPGWARSR